MSDRGPSVLVVDDDTHIRTLVQRLLNRAGFETIAAASAAECLEILSRGFCGVIVLDIGLPDRPGTDLFEDIREVSPGSPVVFLTGQGSADVALDMIQGGAFQFIEKVHMVQRLVPTVTQASEHLSPPSQSRAGPVHHAFDEIITRSDAMLSVLQSLQSAIESRVPVLIRGDSGTGKELVARALHQGSPRKAGPFVAVNCAGIPDDLLEAEIFGYERGAFTGAVERKPGRFDLAQHGTLLLDEIGEMQPRLQAKLLRVLQNGEYQRLGGVTTLKADVRLLSATHRNLEREVERGRFREDLYYRLAVFTVDLPPLRDRQGDVPLLTRHFLKKRARFEHKQIDAVDPMAAELLASFSFPGNVRQLENIISHAVVSCKGPTLTVADFPPSFLRAVAMERKRGHPNQPEGSVPPGLETPRPYTSDDFPSLADLERKHIQAAIEVARGNKAKAARMLGISRMTLYRKLHDHGLDDLITVTR